MRDVKVLVIVLLCWYMYVRVLSLKVSISQFSQLQANDNYFAACYDNGVLHVCEDLSIISHITTFVNITGIHIGSQGLQ